MEFKRVIRTPDLKSGVVRRKRHKDRCKKPPGKVVRSFRPQIGINHRPTGHRPAIVELPEQCSRRTKLAAPPVLHGTLECFGLHQLTGMEEILPIPSPPNSVRPENETGALFPPPACCDVASRETAGTGLREELRARACDDQAEPGIRIPIRTAPGLSGTRESLSTDSIPPTGGGFRCPVRWGSRHHMECFASTAGCRRAACTVAGRRSRKIVAPRMSSGPLPGFAEQNPHSHSLLPHQRTTEG